MTADVASRVDADADGRRSRHAGEAAPVSKKAGASQAALDALLCELLPRQGCWSDEGYLWLTDHGNRLVEFTDGRIEELPKPTDAPGTGG